MEDTGKKLASFYMDVFEMRRCCMRKKKKAALSFSLFDILTAILPNNGCRTRPTGFHHFGFEAESGEKIVRRKKKTNPNKLP